MFVLSNQQKFNKLKTANKPTITVETTVNAPLEKLWETRTEPTHITKWCQASDDWHAPYSKNDLKVGGKFTTTMAAKDGSFSFDFGGIYTRIEENKNIEYTMADGRKVSVHFTSHGGSTKVVENFETEDVHPLEVQKGGWQAILNNFKNYTEQNQ